MKILPIIVSLLIGAVIGAVLVRSTDKETTPLSTEDRVVAVETPTSTEVKKTEPDVSQQKPPEPVDMGSQMEFPTPDGTTLIMVGESLTEVPRFVFGQSDLVLLDLSHNKLTSVPAEVRNLTTLRTLDLSYNTLTNIPAELGQLSSLVSLNLSYNKLTGLPYELGNLTNLETLDLRGNKYSTQDLDRIKKTLVHTEILVD